MARCRVCHRELHNAAHIAAGVGPVCAQRAAAFGVGTGSPEQTAEQAAEQRNAQLAAQTAAKLARIGGHLARLAEAIEDNQQYRMAAYDRGTPEQQADADWLVWLCIRWYERWSAIERRVTVASRRAA